MSDADNDKMTLVLAKLDRIIELLEAKPLQPVKTRGKEQKDKPPPLSKEEVEEHQRAFDRLFDDWSAGKELEVQRELEDMDAEEIRRFADANNLNVTTKMPKQKVLNLISGRFRERRQLTRQHFRRGQE